MTVAEGTRRGRYEIVGLLAAGGMGEVYRARDRQPYRMLRRLLDVFIQIADAALRAAPFSSAPGDGPSRRRRAP